MLLPHYPLKTRMKPFFAITFAGHYKLSQINSSAKLRLICNNFNQVSTVKHH